MHLLKGLTETQVADGSRPLVQLKFLPGMCAMSDCDQNPVCAREIDNRHFCVVSLVLRLCLLFKSCSPLQTVKGMLDNPNEPVSDLSYFDCIESVMENSKVSLAVLLASLPTVGKNRDALRVHRSVAPSPGRPMSSKARGAFAQVFLKPSRASQSPGGLVEHRLLGHTHTPKFLIPYIPEWARLCISDQFPGQALWSRSHTLRTTAYTLSGMSYCESKHVCPSPGTACWGKPINDRI